MPCNDNTTAVSSPLATEHERIKGIMASLPPTKAQYPTHDNADTHNVSILTVRGLRTTATGNELFDLADLALQNFEIPATPKQISGNDTNLIATQDTGAVDGSTTASGETLSIVTTFEPFYFFFYGSLQIPDVLQSVCEIEDKDSLTLRKNASIEGWKIKMWGPYPALVPATTDDEGTVKGMVWLCEELKHVMRLCTYESNAYRMAYCDVSTTNADGTSAEVIKNARTFVFNQNPDELADGSFDTARYYQEMLGFA
ncbi:hypothetical protein F4801DRAFT_577149 [Xylaria longipes]|nr:hypothetical protein F4801DRAFT_577149 [Xylaria longipes]